MSDNILFISNNVKGLQNKTKRIKIFEYLKNNSLPNGVIFMQETHSCINDEKRWCDDFGGTLYFSHGTTNSCGVAIGHFGSKKFELVQKLTDNNGRLLVVEAKIDDNIFILVNIYNANIESEQILTLNELNTLLESLNITDDKKVIIGGDFNFIFDISFDALGGNPKLKKGSITKFIEIKEKFDLCDIWKVRNPNKQRFTFRQNNKSGFLQRRLDYFFVSNSIQVFVGKTDIIASFSTDHSPILVSFQKHDDFQRGKGLWKFNSSLSQNKDYIKKMKKHILDTINKSEQENQFNEQMKWDFLKYEIRKFTRGFSKQYAKEQRQERENLEQKLNFFEANCQNFEENYDYLECKNKLNDIYEKKANGIKIRSKCNWYEFGEKSSKFFLNLEKSHGLKSQVRSIFVDNKKYDDAKEINKQLLVFYKSLFSEKIENETKFLEEFFKNIDLPKLSHEQINICEGEITEKEIFNALKSMDKDKSPGNDGLSKEFYELFWNEIKKPFLASVREGFLNEELSISQQQAVIKLIEKRDRDKRLIKNWRPISLLNTDTKLVSKALAMRLKQVIPSLVSYNQTAYVENRFIGENGRLISDILEITKQTEIEGYLLTIDIEKAFDSVNHFFLLHSLKEYGFGKQFLQWIRTILKNQQSCVLNGGITTPYFKLERGTRQGDPISAYLFILVLEIFFKIVKENPNIKGLNIFNHEFLYSAYADDTTFFIKDKTSALEIIRCLNMFSKYSGLKPNTSKCEIAGIGVLKGAKVALCGMQSVDLRNESIKILGTYFSYDKELEQSKNFVEHISQIQNVLKMWRMRQLSLEGRITVFKSLAVSKIIHLAMTTSIHKSTITQLENIQRDFIWQGKKPKIKHDTLCQNYENGGLKNVDINAKVLSLQCSWIRKLYDNDFHEWKIIPSFLIHQNFGNNFKFHNNIDFSKKVLKKFPHYYQEVFKKWKNYFTCQPTTPSVILSEFIWFNSYIKIDKTPVFFPSFSDKKLNFIGQLFGLNGKVKTWIDISSEFGLKNFQKFSWLQIIHSIPKTWKLSIASDNGNAKNLVFYDHHLSRNCQIYCLTKLTCRELYSLIIKSETQKPTSQGYFEKEFEGFSFEWKNIYLLPRKVTIDSSLRNFQYKILNNVLFLNKMLQKFGIVNSSVCSFCKQEDETILHLYYHCNVTKDLWSKLKNLVSRSLAIPDITPQSAIFGFHDIHNTDFIIINHLLLIFKWYVYKLRDKGKIDLKSLLHSIKSIKYIEENISENNVKRKKRNELKWKKVMAFLK